MRARPPANPALRAAGLRARSTAPPEVQPQSFRSRRRLPVPPAASGPWAAGFGAAGQGRARHRVSGKDLHPHPHPNLQVSAPRFQALSRGAWGFLPGTLQLFGWGTSGMGSRAPWPWAPGPSQKHRELREKSRAGGQLKR